MAGSSHDHAALKQARGCDASRLTPTENGRRCNPVQGAPAFLAVLAVSALWKSAPCGGVRLNGRTVRRCRQRRELTVFRGSGQYIEICASHSTCPTTFRLLSKAAGMTSRDGLSRRWLLKGTGQACCRRIRFDVCLASSRGSRYTLFSRSIAFHSGTVNRAQKTIWPLTANSGSFADDDRRGGQQSASLPYRRSLRAKPIQERRQAGLSPDTAPPRQSPLGSDRRSSYREKPNIPLVDASVSCEPLTTASCRPCSALWNWLSTGDEVQNARVQASRPTSSELASTTADPVHRLQSD